MIKKKIKYFILILIIFGGNTTFSQGSFEASEKEEKIYLLEEYKDIKDELEEKILYVQNRLKDNEELYGDILLEYEELRKELLADMKKESEN